jgi:Fe-S-cluster containining protein
MNLFTARRRVQENVEILAPHLACKGPGCWGCCRGQVELTGEELERLLPLVTEEAWERTKAIPKDAVRRQTICPLLDPRTKLCSVYSERPLVCRAYTAVGEWKHCYPELAGEQTVKSPTSPLVAASTYILEKGDRKLLIDELMGHPKGRTS